VLLLQRTILSAGKRNFRTLLQYVCVVVVDCFFCARQLCKVTMTVGRLSWNFYIEHSVKRRWHAVHQHYPQ